MHWGGDSEATYASMAESLRGGLSLGLSGFGFWSHDIGGFEGTPTPALFKRWLAFGLLSSHSRLHGSSSYRVPWLFDEESVAVLRHFTRLKLRLMPYLYEAARVAHEEGTPVMRAMVLEFPDDPGCAHLERQYMLGPDLLVAPVFSDEGDVTHYVPEGTWTHYVTGRTVTGPRWVRERHDAMSVPLLVRPGAVLPVGAHADRPDYAHADGVTLRTYGLERGARVTVRVGEVTFTVVREGTPCGPPAVTRSPPGRWRPETGWRTPRRAPGSSPWSWTDGEDHRCGAAGRGLPQHRVVRPQPQAPDLRGDPAARRGGRPRAGLPPARGRPRPGRQPLQRAGAGGAAAVGHRRPGRDAGSRCRW